MNRLYAKFMMVVVQYILCMAKFRHGQGEITHAQFYAVEGAVKTFMEEVQNYNE